MTPAETKEALLKTVQFDLYSPNLDREAEIREMCYQWGTGKGHREIIQELNPSMDEDALDKLMKIYVPFNPFVRNPSVSLFEKMYRSDNIKKSIEGDPEDITKLTNSVKYFFGNKTPDGYLQDNFLEWQFRKPNAWFLVLSEDVVVNGNLTRKPIPVLIESEYVRNYTFDKSGIEETLTVEFTHKEEIYKMVNGKPTFNRGKTVSTFYLYAANHTWVMSEFYEKPYAEIAKGGKDAEILALDTTKGERKFLLERFDTSNTEFPGRKVGAYVDPESNYQVRVPPDYGAKDVHKDIINHKSKKDLIENKHMFPKLLAFRHTCSICEGEKVVTDPDGDEIQCRNCGGTGAVQPVKHAAEMSTFPWPDNVENASEVPKLENMFHYINTPIQDIEYYDSQLGKDAARFQIAMFGIVTTEKYNPMAAKTATEIDAEWDSVKNVVYKAAQGYSSLWILIHKLSSQYIEAKTLEFTHKFALDLKLESMDLLLQRYKMGKDSGLDFITLFGINCDILSKQNQNDLGIVEEVKAWQKQMPFQSLPKELLFAELEKRDDDDIDKVLFLNSSIIFQKVQSETGGYFRNLDFDDGRALVEKIVKEYAKSIKYLEMDNSETLYPFAKPKIEKVEEVAVPLGEN